MNTSPRSQPDSPASQARNELAGWLRDTASGDREALKRVYDRTSAKLFGICLRILRDREMAEDALQDSFVKIWRRAGRYDPAKASPITWLATIARNTALDELRRRGRANLVPDDAIAELADDAPGADRQTEQAEDRERILVCLDELEDRQAELIREAFYEGCTYSELADRKGVPLGTVKSWIRRGLAKLKGCLDHD